MWITPQQVGSSIRFLECQLADPLSRHPTALPDSLAIEDKPTAPSYIRKLIDSGAIN